MEYYTLDSSLRRDTVIQGFQSVIWTERYNTSGDFQIVTKSTFLSRNQLQEGTWITRQGSTYVAIVDTVSDAEDENGVRLITVTGSMLEGIFNDRVAMPGLTDTTTTPNWVLTGVPGDIARQMFNLICVECVFDPNDSIPFYAFGTLLPTGNIEEPSTPITVSAAPDTLYNTLSKLCASYNLGFRLVKDGENGRIFFEVYTGNDLTTRQSDYNPVIFDPDMDNLSQINYLSSSAAYKNVAYVFAQNGAVIVYAPTATSNVSGADRHVLLVNSSNTTDAGDALTQQLQAEGQQALAAQQRIYTFDGTLPPNSPYVYGRDYNLGDVVEERNEDNEGNFMLVTEQIFSSDDTGEHAYPTLSIVDSTTPGSWNAWPSQQYWNQVPDTLYWADLS